MQDYNLSSRWIGNKWTYFRINKGTKRLKIFIFDIKLWKSIIKTVSETIQPNYCIIKKQNSIKMDRRSKYHNRLSKKKIKIMK